MLFSSWKKRINLVLLHKMILLCPNFSRNISLIDKQEDSPLNATNGCLIVSESDLTYYFLNL